MTMTAWENFQTYLFENIFQLAIREIVISANTEFSNDSLTNLQLQPIIDQNQNLSPPILSLPEEVLLQVFGFLPAPDLVRCSEVCRLWSRLSSDCLLWERTLEVESRSWQTVTSDSYGRINENSPIAEQLHPKQTYIRCTHVTKPFASNFMHNMAKIWRSFFTSKKVKLLMFGPGLDSSRTIRVVHKMVHDKCVEFEPVGMIPGTNGFGTGLTFKLNIDEEFHNFDLITLHSHRVEGRGGYADQNERIRTSALFNPLPPEDCLDELKATEQVRALCENTDGLVFVVDAENKVEDFNHTRHELRAVLSAFRECTGIYKSVPILVLSLVQSSESPRNISALQLAQRLQLFSLHNQWYVQDSVVKDMSGISRGILWIVQKWLTS